MTDIEAIIATITHWTEHHLYLRLFGGDRAFGEIFTEFACPVCVQHLDDKDCRKCVLVIRGTILGCAHPSHPYAQARRACANGDKPRFMAARSALLKRLQRALKRIENA